MTRRIAALSRFISKSIDKCEECEKDFQAIKEPLAQPPVLSKAVDGEDLFVYLAVTEHAISAALVREEDKVQHPVYYVSKRLIGAESRYPMIKKLAYCLVLASRKLRPYFKAHPIKVLTDQPLCQV